MLVRHRLALLCSLAIGGCYLSHGPAHEPPPPEPDAGPPLVDSGPVCAIGTNQIAVRVEPLGNPALCTETHLPTARLLGPAVPEPEVDGVRLHFDFGGPLAILRPCDVVVEHVGTDLAAQIDSSPEVTLDWGPSFVSIQRRTTCACDGCGCDIALVFYAADGDPTRPPSPPFEVAFDRGAVQCPAPSACESGSWWLHGDALGRARADAREGTDARVGPFTMRVVRDPSIFGPCAGCATCGSLWAAWAVWSPAAMCLSEGGDCAGRPDACCPGTLCCMIGGGTGSCVPEGTLCLDGAAHVAP